LSALRETRPPVPEDRPAREARRLHAAQKKQAKETAKKRAIRKAKKAEALKKRRRQQTIDGVPLSPSPSETVSGEDDGSSDEDDDALSRYEIATRLGDLPDIRPLLEPIRGVLLGRRGRGGRGEEGGEGIWPLEGRGRFTPDPARGVDGDVRTSRGLASSGRGGDGGTGVVIGGGAGGSKDPRPAGLGSTKGAGRCVGRGSQERSACW
jgi:hypothetical protein